MEEAAKKKASLEMIDTLTVQLEALEREVKKGMMKEIRLEDERQQKEAKWEKERLEVKKKEEAWEREREELKESLRKKEKELTTEKFLWGARFDEGSFDSWTRKKIACVLYNSACAATTSEGDNSGDEEGGQMSGREKALQRVASCMGTFPDVVGSWVTQPLVSSGPSGVFSKESEPMVTANGGSFLVGAPRPVPATCGSGPQVHATAATGGWVNTAMEELEWGEEFLSDEGSGDQCALESDYLC